MSKTVKIILIVSVITVVSYYGYKWYSKNNSAALPNPGATGASPADAAK